MATASLDQRRIHWSRLTVSAVPLAVLTAVVTAAGVLPGETATVEAVNGLPTWVGGPLEVVMQAGTLWVGLVVVALVAVLTHRRGLVPPAAVGLAVLAAFRLDNVLKDLVDRPRPSAVVPGLHVREQIDGFGFPSGHTAMACAIAGALHPLLTVRWRVVVWGIAATVALARMYVGVHYPLDLVGGAALGVALSAGAWLVVERLPACWFEPAATADPTRAGASGDGH